MPMPPLTANALAAELESSHIGPDTEILGLSPLSDARTGDLTFAIDPRANASAVTTALKAGAVVLVPPDADIANHRGTLIPVANPRAAFAMIVARHFDTRPAAGIAATATIHPSARIHPTAHIGDYSVIRENAVVEEGVEIRAHVVIHRGVVIGARTLIKSHAVIGEEGFGIEKDAAGDNLRIPHIGSVRLGHDVEVGSFTTVCSGTITPTTVGDHTKIDDHVHVSHNCRIGRNVIITACAEISGSVVIGDDTWIGPNASIIQGVTLGEHSLLGIGAVAVKSIPANEVQIGNPARRFRDNPRA